MISEFGIATGRVMNSLDYIPSSSVRLFVKLTIRNVVVVANTLRACTYV